MIADSRRFGAIRDLLAELGEHAPQPRFRELARRIECGVERFTGHEAFDGALKEAALAQLARAQVARRVGYVPQGHVAQFAYTVREAVLMGRTAHVSLFAAPGEADRQAAARAIAALGIESLADRVVTELSGGERQLAMIARALAQGARALVLDEPTASLDFGNQVRVLREIRRLATEGYAIVFSTHDPGQAFLAASRVLLLAQGGVLRQGAPQDVITAENLHAVYGVQVRVAALDDARVCLPAL